MLIAFQIARFFLRFRPPSVSGNPTPAAGYIINIFNPLYGQFTPPNPGPQTNRLDVQNAWGFYIQDQIKLSDSFHIRLGGRFDDLQTEALNRLTNSRSDSKDNRFSPQAGFVYRPNDCYALYGAYGQGFRPNSGADFLGKPFDPEESESFELGSKITLMDGNIEATLAAFSMTKSNIITSDPVNSGFSLAIGEAKSQGFEADLVAEFPGELDVRLSYAFVDAEVSKDGLDPNFALIIRKGDRLINIPKHSFSAQLSKEFDLGDRELELGAKLLHVGDRLGETATSFELPAYTTLGLFVTYELNDHLELSGQINNLGDTKHYTNSFSRLWVAPGAPRHLSVSLHYSF